MRTTSALLAEEVDSESGALLGNFPQAFSHIGLINAARAISQAQTGTRPMPADHSAVSVSN
jgi:alpha,alpha-trehalase